MVAEMRNVELEDGQSAGIVSENIEKMKELFPDAFSENGVDFDTLRQLLGDESVLDEGEEKYGLNWHGKKKARQIALTPSMGTLLPCPIESRQVARKNIHSIGYGVLFACLDETINTEQVEDIAQAIVAWYNELAPSSDTHVFFRDSAFRDDISKTNMAAILEQNGITHVRSL